jgi:hypothetical protein
VVGDGLLDLPFRRDAQGCLHLPEPRLPAAVGLMGAEDLLPEVVEGELVDLDALNPQPLQHPPALRVVCACGKDGTPEAHGYNPITGHRALTCDEVLEIDARVKADQARGRRSLSGLARRYLTQKGWI